MTVEQIMLLGILTQEVGIVALGHNKLMSFIAFPNTYGFSFSSGQSMPLGTNNFTLLRFLLANESLVYT